MQTKRTATFSILAMGVACFSQSAFAHPGHPVSGFVGGISHPFSGIDHILAMMAVGIWAAQLGGRALWAVPGAFVALMAAGGGMGMSVGHSMPFIENGVAASVLVLGLLIALAVRAPLYVSIPLVGVFAAFHGFAHGTELTEGASALGFCGGFVVATIVLHAAGMGLALLTKRMITAPLVFRTAGAAITIAGLMLTLGWIKA